MRAIKADMNDYSLYEASVANDAALPNACKGKINFHVSSVSIQLETKTSVTTSGNASVELPVGGAKLGGSGSASNAEASTQTVSFKLEPKAAQVGLANVPAPKAGSFYAVLRGLREALLKASDAEPCFTFPKEKQENTIKFGFTVTEDKSAGGKISFLIFSLGAERKDSNAYGNTVTVAFVADPGAAVLTPN